MTRNLATSWVLVVAALAATPGSAVGQAGDGTAQRPQIKVRLQPAAGGGIRVVELEPTSTTVARVASEELELTSVPIGGSGRVTFAIYDLEAPDAIVSNMPDNAHDADQTSSSWLPVTVDRGRPTARTATTPSSSWLPQSSNATGAAVQGGSWLPGGESSAVPLRGVDQYLTNSGQSAGSLYDRHAAAENEAGMASVPVAPERRLPMTAGVSAGRDSVPRAPVADTTAAGVGSYRLGAGDTVDIFVWRNPELSRQVPVRPDGYISLPLAGEVAAVGKTAAELEAELTRTLGEYVQMPTVSVTVTDIQSLVIYVIGRVAKPGPQTLARNVTVLQAISMAGGLTEFADRDDIVILRTVEGRQVRIPFRYSDALRGDYANGGLFLQAGDVINVP